MTPQALNRLLGPIKQRLFNILVRGVVTAINDKGGLQLVQVQLTGDEIADELERFQPYGFSGVPLKGAECLVLFLGGNRDHGIVLNVDDRSLRPTGLKAGETIQYGPKDKDSGGKQRFLMDEKGNIKLTCGQSLTIDCDKPITISGPTHTLYIP